ncbi:2-dehydro-3-deoxy-6-phosphogalactonate aldolase [Sphingomonas sp. PL-96]|uniref:2-dehydro-3-deoxy-6-phosphogalactonate aldolase n=1 Tax=Sphingomonas sp. PL-96 TaxID=2887201 RepID=UPI001E4AC99D|nr:2-dehydro-3-deoxy-6-phosphogalactonate aldolase [Sphingomonas sp. PL-96]MCC2975745.1 2-dehydro-3-deoxy-6-phosphogalactonate aldolase [Sphingomonas sp. PL-96]
MTLETLLGGLPLVAILRGLTPDEAPAIADALFDVGFRCLEVPLNSPEPFESIRRIVDRMGDRALIGAGTVLTVENVRRMADVGGKIVISPNADVDVIAATKDAGLQSLPAFFTPTEAFRAIAAGADALKLFPAELAGPQGLKAMRAVLPKTTPVFPVGGIDPDTMGPYLKAGAAGFGIGSSLYAPGRSVEDVRARGEALVAGFKAARA